jgi:uncharacterized OB-fold protein
MTTATASLKPMPESDEASEPFYESAARGVLLLRGCRACGAWLGPDARFCSECLSEDLDWKEASGRAVLFTFGIMHQQFPGFENDVPYNIAVVQLAEGPRMTSNVVGCSNDALAVGMPLKVVFEDAGNGTPIPRFTPA